jgi:hypothetical protein
MRSSCFSTGHNRALARTVLMRIINISNISSFLVPLRSFYVIPEDGCLLGLRAV